MKIHKLPSVLVMQLKRFKYNEKLGYMTKLDWRVSFPLELRVWNTTPDSTDADRLYMLFAVVVHIGASLGHGHYVSLVYSSQRQSWVLFDDDLVMEVEPDVLAKVFGPGGMASLTVDDTVQRPLNVDLNKGYGLVDPLGTFAVQGSDGMGIGGGGESAKKRAKALEMLGRGTGYILFYQAVSDECI